MIDKPAPSTDEVKDLVERLAKEFGCNDKTIRTDLRLAFAKVLVRVLEKGPKDGPQTQEDLVRKLGSFNLKRTLVINLIESGNKAIVDKPAKPESLMNTSTIANVICFLRNSHHGFLHYGNYDCLRRLLGGYVGVREPWADEERVLPRRKNLRLLLLGTHDDVGVCKDSLKGQLRNLSHDPKSPEYKDQTDSESVLNTIDNKVFKTTHHGYVVIVGTTYGRLLESIDLDANSIRHFELDRAFAASERYKQPLIVVSATEGSELEKRFIESGKSLLEQWYAEAPEMIDRDRRMLTRINERLQWGHTYPFFFRESSESVADLSTRIDEGLESYDAKLLHEAELRENPNALIETQNEVVRDSAAKLRRAYSEFREVSRENTKPGFCLVLHSTDRRSVIRAANELDDELYWPAENIISEEWSLYNLPADKRIFRMLRGSCTALRGKVKDNDISRLAEFLVASGRPYMLLLKNLFDPSALVRFHEEFWQPLYEAAEKELAKTDTQERWALINIVFCIESNRVHEVLSDLAARGKEIDYKRYLCLEVSN